MHPRCAHRSSLIKWLRRHEPGQQGYRKGDCCITWLQGSNRCNERARGHCRGDLQLCSEAVQGHHKMLCSTETFVPPPFE